MEYLRSVSTGLGGVLPEAENELGDIGNMLSGLMFEAGTSSGMSLNFNSVNEDAAKIFDEAAIVAEQRVSSNFPDLPLECQLAQLTKQKLKTEKAILLESFSFFFYYCMSLP